LSGESRRHGQVDLVHANRQLRPTPHDQYAIGENAMFKTILKTTITAVALSAPVSSPKADMRVTASYGAWRTSEGLNDGGAAMCSASLFGADRAFLVKVEREGFFLHVFKDGWKIPEGQSVDVTLQVDNAPPMSFVGTGLSTSDPGFGGFVIGIAPDAVWQNTGRTMISEVVSVLSSGLHLRLLFPGGDERPWDGSLKGSSAALTAMMKCGDRIQTAARPTQPFGTSPATPEQSLGPAASQPFGTIPPALPPELESANSERASGTQSKTGENLPDHTSRLVDKADADTGPKDLPADEDAHVPPAPDAASGANSVPPLTEDDYPPIPTNVEDFNQLYDFFKKAVTNVDAKPSHDANCNQGGCEESWLAAFKKSLVMVVEETPKKDAKSDGFNGISAKRFFCVGQSNLRRCYYDQGLVQNEVFAPSSKTWVMDREIAGGWAMHNAKPN
jgi:hypothetical protein